VCYQPIKKSAVFHKKQRDHWSWFEHNKHNKKCTTRPSYICQCQKFPQQIMCNFYYCEVRGMKSAPLLSVRTQWYCWKRELLFWTFCGKSIRSQVLDRNINDTGSNPEQTDWDVCPLYNWKDPRIPVEFRLIIGLKMLFMASV